METQDIQMLKYAIGHAMLNPRLEWRHHGIGLLQAYLHEGEDETRIHIWHPQLVLGEFNDENGLVHDHRFGFKSVILLGNLYNEIFESLVIWNTSYGPEDWHALDHWVMYECEHARSAKEKTGAYNMPLGRHNEWEYRVTRKGEWINAGQTYEMHPRVFHNTTSKELTVSLIHKRSVVTGSARILAKKKVELVHAFSRSKPYEEFRDYIIEASQRLLF